MESKARIFSGSTVAASFFGAAQTNYHQSTPGDLRVAMMIQQLSHEKNPGWIGFIGDYTIQLYGDYNKLLYKDPY